MPQNPETAPQPEQTPHIPTWAERERASDLLWITDNLHIFWPAVQQGYHEQGRGCLLVDTTSRPTGAGHPFGYVPEALLRAYHDEHLDRMLRAYDPTAEFVIVLLKTLDRQSYYRYCLLSPELPTSLA